MEGSDNVFLKFLNALEEKQSSTVRFFDRQDYYSVYNDDVELLAKNYYKSMEVVKYFKNASVPYININKSSCDGVFRYLLVNNQYKVEVYSSSVKHGRDNNWALDYTASPGNLERFQDVLFGNLEVRSSNTLLSLNIKKISEDYKVYLGFCDLDNGVFMLGNFEENFSGFNQLTNLTSALFQLNCRECLVPANDTRPEMAAVRSTVQQSGLLLTEVKKQKFSADSVLDIVTKLVCKSKFSGVNSVTKISEMEGEDSLGCLGAVVGYMDLMADNSFYDFFEIHSFQLNNFMRLGEQCSRALNILPSPSDISTRDSLYGLLNCCRTGLGSRLLMQWLKQPLLDVHLINNRLDVVESLVSDTSLRCGIYDNLLRRVPDLQRITKRLQRSNATLQDLYKLYTALQLAKEVLKLVSDYDGPLSRAIQSEFCGDLEAIGIFTESLCQMVERNMDFEAIQNYEYKIKAEVDPNLEACHVEMEKVKEKINKEFEKVTERLNLQTKKTVKLDVSANLGYYMRVSRKDEKMIRDKSDVIVIETLKDGVKFHSNRMQTLNQSYQEFRSQYLDYQKSIVEDMLRTSCQYVSALHKLGGIFAKLDVFASLAVTVVSAPAKYVRPTLLNSDTRRICLRNCRHPLVEMQHNVSYIANDVTFDEERTFKVITGPNMGGKSTYIRSVGLCVVLAQIGSFVPCDAAELSLCDRVMTRIGAGDCQLNGVSTFMAEMLDVSWILKTATAHSLLIIDELGRGTSTFDGLGLAWSISEHIITELRAFCLFATHFHELTKLPAGLSAASNLHVSAQTLGESLVFLYKMSEGPSMRSFGIEVGKAAGLPEDVLEVARLKLLEYESGSDWDCHGLDEEKLATARAAIKEYCEMETDDDDLSVICGLRAALGID